MKHHNKSSRLRITKQRASRYSQHEPYSVHNAQISLRNRSVIHVLVSCMFEPILHGSWLLSSEGNAQAYLCLPVENNIWNTVLISSYNKLKDKSSTWSGISVEVFEVLCGFCCRGILILRHRNLSKQCLLRFLCLKIKIFTVW